MSAADVIEERSEESEDDDFVPDAHVVTEIEAEKAAANQQAPVDEIKKKRMREKASAIWAEMNGPPKKKVKEEEKETVLQAVTPTTSSGSRFSFTSPTDLIKQAQKARETLLSDEKSDDTQNTTVYEFAGEKVAVKEASSPSLRKGNLDDIIEGLKTKKISTIQKTKLDWDEYKKQNNLSEELEYHNKDGYLEKVAFKQRTEQRVHDLQKKCRTQNVRK